MITCPRCGEQGYLEKKAVKGKRGVHVYLYCVHVHRVGKQVKRVKHYMRAEEYTYVVDKI